jgi:hypothetical protein
VFLAGYRAIHYKSSSPTLLGLPGFSLLSLPEVASVSFKGYKLKNQLPHQ